MDHQLHHYNHHHHRHRRFKKYGKQILKASSQSHPIVHAYSNIGESALKQAPADGNITENLGDDMQDEGFLRRHVGQDSITMKLSRHQMMKIYRKILMMTKVKVVAYRYIENENTVRTILHWVL